MLSLLKTTTRDFLDDDCPTNAAALAYYAVFSFPAVLFLLIFVVGLVIDPDTVQERIVGEFGGLFGEGGGQQVESMVRSAQERTTGSGNKVALTFDSLTYQRGKLITLLALGITLVLITAGIIMERKAIA